MALAKTQRLCNLFCADKLLWGGLAGNASLGAALQDALVRLDAWLTARGWPVVV